MLLGASSHRPRKCVCRHGLAWNSQCGEQGPHGDTPMRKGCLGKGSHWTGSLLETGGGPWEPSILPGQVLESRAPYEVCRWLQRDRAVPAWACLARKVEIPTKREFLPGWERSSIRQAGNRWVAQPRHSHQQHHVCQQPDPATTQDQGI